MDKDSFECIVFVLSRSQSLRSEKTWDEFQTRMVNGNIINVDGTGKTDEEFLLAVLESIISEENITNIVRFLETLDDVKLLKEADEIREMLHLKPKPLPNLDPILQDKDNQDVTSKYVYNNIAGLSETTKPISLYQYLLNKKLVDDNDLGKYREAECEDNFSKSFCLYNILVNYPTHLSNYITALEMNNQYEPDWILRRCYHELPNTDLFASEPSRKTSETKIGAVGPAKVSSKTPSLNCVIVGSKGGCSILDVVEAIHNDEASWKVANPFGLVPTPQHSGYRLSSAVALNTAFFCTSLSSLAISVYTHAKYFENVLIDKQTTKS